MSPTDGPAVLVKLVPAAGGIRMEFHASRPGVPSLELTMPDTGSIARARQQLDSGLSRLKDTTIALRIDDDDLTAILQTMAGNGRLMMRTLFGGNPARVQQLQTFWRSAIPTWQNPGHTAVVECLGFKEHMLPVEYFPAFDAFGADEPASSRQDFLRKCRCFVGFSCVVRRRLLPLPVHGGDALRTDADGRLRLRYLHHEKLPGAQAEYRWLASEGHARARVLGPYPLGHETTAELAEQIFDPTYSPTGTTPAGPDHIQHFSCHCYAGPRKAPEDYELTLSGHGNELRLRLGELGQLLYRYGARRPRHSMDMPFVMLNACGSSTVDPSSSLSFPELFLSNENRCVLGTETAIPDDLATIYSQEFYRALLLRGKPIGYAAHHARIHLLRAYRNPLGLAYVTYGNTNLKIVDPEPASNDKI